MMKIPRQALAVILVLLFCFFGCVSAPFKLDTLSTGSSVHKLNLVFVPLNYPDREDFLKDREKLAQRLQKAAPFNEFPDAVKFWDLAMDERQSRKFLIFQKALPPVRVDAGFLKQIFKKIGANYKLILVDNTGTVDCPELSSPEATSILIVGRRHFDQEPFLKSAFFHELGHSLGLRDESPKSYAQSCAPGYPNCAASKEEAAKWWGALLGKGATVRFFHGCCGRADHFRPTEASLMNDVYYASNFGPVNEAYLRKVLKGYRPS